uniref:Antibacterial peptide Cp1 n=1 Tax=Copris tripartitus TaxID=438892 RepID=A9XFZ9_COPTR|nr:antibacterial peptide Cp1 [Copris tripartitus]
MGPILIVAVTCIASMAAALPYPEIVENEAGDVFQLVPLERVRRGSVYGNVDITDPGRLIVGAKGTPIDNANHRWDTHVFATDNIRHHSPLTVGGEASYLHKPTGSTAHLAGTRTEQWGTDLKASGRYNFFQDKTTNANVEAFASKHIGGFPGNQPTDYGVMFNVRKDF